MASSDYIYNDQTGVIVPDTQQVLTDVQNEFLDAFGQDLNTNPDTPQGVLITTETIARTAVINNNATIANQINPNLAGGVYLDALCALTGLNRIAQTYSQAAVNVTGIAGTVIPTTATASDSAGNLYQNMLPITIASDGTGSGTFQAVLPGPIQTPPNTLTQIVYTGGVLGWETITNPSASSIGQGTQSDQSLKKQRLNTLALQGSALPEAIKSALNALDPSVNISFQENISSNTVVINGITMLPKSVYFCVSDYGYVNAPFNIPIVSDTTVATVALSKKSSGSSWNNSGIATSRSVNVTDPTSGQVYTVLFDRPQLIPILIKVTISAATAPTNYQTIVPNALLTYINGQLNNNPGFAIFNTVYTTELIGALKEQYPNIFIINLQTSLTSPVSYSTNPIPIGINQQATAQFSSIQVVLQ